MSTGRAKFVLKQWKPESPFFKMASMNCPIQCIRIVGMMWRRPRLFIVIHGFVSPRGDCPRQSDVR